MKNVLYYVLAAVILFPFLEFSAGCANMIPPTGGPRDSLPPVLLNVNPVDSSTGFRSKRIVFSFDEFVQVDQIQQNLLVTPTPKVMPTVDGHLRTVTVTLRDTLEPNTTYTLDFGNALKDVNEGNIYRDFNYTFSTGTYLDSLTLEGSVILSESGLSDSTLIVMLHRNLTDSAVAKEAPRYIARVNRQGNFQFRNLPPGTFALYALKDEGGGRRYMSPRQVFAFADSPVTVGVQQEPIVLYAYAEQIDSSALQGTAGSLEGSRPNPQDRRLKFTSNLRDGQLSLLENLEVRFEPTPLRTFDSSRIRLTTDSLVAIENYRAVLDSTRSKLTVSTAWTEGTGYKLFLDTAFAVDTTGKKLLRPDTLEFRTRRTRDYGQVRLRFLNLDLSKNPILQFVQNDEVKYTHVFTSRDFVSRMFQPGEYDLRIVYDENRNARWDPGKFYGQRKQPEKVLPVPRKLNVKANWDNEVDITL